MNSSCKNCNPLCFEPVNDDCITFTGSSNSEIGINQNDSLKVTLNKLISFVQKLSDKVNECNICKDKEEESSISTTTTSSSSLPITITSAPEDLGIAYTYNVPSLPTGHKLLYSTISVEGQKSGYNAVLNTSEALQSGGMLKPNNFPANLNVSIKTVAEDGEHLFNMVLPISSLNNTTNTEIISSQTKNVTAVSQPEVNSLLNTKMSSIEDRLKQVSSITDTSVPGNSTAETLLYLINKVKEIENNSN